MKVLMIGPSRKVKGGISTVVNGYYEAGLGELITFSYLRTMVDGSKIRIIEAMVAFLNFMFLIKKHDILHVHIGSLPSFYRKSIFIYWAKKLNKKVILHLHGGNFQIISQSGSSAFLKRVIEHVFGYADKVIVLSRSWKDFFGTFMEESKIEVIYNGVTVPANINKDYDRPSMLFLGRVVREKGIFDLLGILPEITAEYPAVKLYIGGEGESRRLLKVIRNYNLQDNVVLIGWVTGTEKGKYLQESTLFILPSYYEGLPMSLLEAMAYKCSAVTTKVGGIPEVIRHDINGYMVEPGDFKKMKEVIMELVKSRSNRMRIGEEAHNTISNEYSSKRSIAALTSYTTKFLTFASGRGIK